MSVSSLEGLPSSPLLRLLMWSLFSLVSVRAAVERPPRPLWSGWGPACDFLMFALFGPRPLWSGPPLFDGRAEALAAADSPRDPFRVGVLRRHDRVRVPVPLRRRVREKPVIRDLRIQGPVAGDRVERPLPGHCVAVDADAVQVTSLAQCTGTPIDPVKRPPKPPSDQPSTDERDFVV